MGKFYVIRVRFDEFGFEVARTLVNHYNNEQLARRVRDLLDSLETCQQRQHPLKFEVASAEELQDQLETDPPQRPHPTFQHAR